MSGRLMAAVLGAALGFAGPAAGDVEATLNSHWRGALVLTRVPLHSDCGGFYTDNELLGAGVGSGGARRFEAGELVRVERVDVKGKRLDVFLDFAEPVLWPLRDGPFTLYEERLCRAQLQMPQPREVLGDSGRAGEALDRTLALQPSPEAARQAAQWNGRRREPYPADYERTLEEHAAWKASQTNAAVQARLDEAADDALRVADRVDDDPDYLQGFAAGVRKARDRHLGSDCSSLLGGSFSSFAAGPPRDRDEPWRRGFQDGQRLVYGLELMRRLPRCFIPVPAMD